jgi:sugar phosphate isomerase/epimerase
MFSTLAPQTLPARVPVTRQLELASAHGFDALDLPVWAMQRLACSSSIESIRELFASRGLRCGGWMLPFDYQARRTDFKADLTRLRATARLAGELGSPWCYYWIEPTSDELTFAENTVMQVVRVRAIADVLGESGCRLGLEPIGPATLRAGARYEFVHSIPTALELLAAVDRPNVGLLVDCFHWYTSDAELEDLTALSASQVVYVHINDAVAGIDVDEQTDDVRCLPGASGVIDVVAFLGALKQIGYDGPVAVEPFDASLAALPADERVRLAADSLHAVFASAGVNGS